MKYQIQLGFKYDPMKPTEAIILLRSIANEIEYLDDKVTLPKGGALYSIGEPSELIGSWACIPYEPQEEEEEAALNYVDAVIDGLQGED